MSRRLLPAVATAFLAVLALLASPFVSPFAAPAGAAPLTQGSDLVGFTTPSTKIDCLFVPEDNGGITVNCLAEDANWKNPKRQPADCDLDWFPAEMSMTVNGRSATAKPVFYEGSCRGDIGATCVLDSCSTLAYGKTITQGQITCTSLKTGVQCKAKSGRGFLISRSGLKRL
jgi:hypothetical protein